MLFGLAGINFPVGRQRAEATSVRGADRQQAQAMGAGGPGASRGNLGGNGHIDHRFCVGLQL